MAKSSRMKKGQHSPGYYSGSKPVPKVIQGLFLLGLVGTLLLLFME